MELSRLQEEAREWRHRVFPEESRTAPLQALGVCEEAGELAHAVLKMEQGIRGNRIKHLDEAADAVGDTVIFLTGVCDSLGLDLDTCVTNAWNEVKLRDWAANKETG